MHKLFIMGTRDVQIGSIEEAVQHYKDTITHIISGGTKNFYPHSELWARHNEKIVIKYSPKLVRGKSFVESCKERLVQCVNQCDSILFLMGEDSSPSINYVHTIKREKPYIIFEVGGGTYA